MLAQFIELDTNDDLPKGRQDYSGKQNDKWDFDYHSKGRKEGQNACSYNHVTRYLAVDSLQTPCL